jgi:hypothetical protein
MVIDERDPSPDESAMVLGNLVNAPAVGQLMLAEEGNQVECQTILADGKIIEFTKD